MNKISITAVAQEAKVSTATVSRVINEREVVKPATSKRVWAVIEKLGYVPSSRSNSFAGKRFRVIPWQHRTVIFLWTAGHEGGADTETGHDLQAGAAAAVRQHGVSMLVDYLTPDATLPPIIASGKIDGILLHGPSIPVPLENQLRKFPAVWLFYQGSHDWGDRVEPDHRLTGRKALEYLISQGCRNLCVVTHTAGKISDFSTERADAFQQFARYHSVPCRVLGEELPVTTTKSERFIQAGQVVSDFCALSPRPDGMFIASDVAEYMYEHLYRRGLTPMKDVLIVGGDREGMAQHRESPFVGIDISAYEIGQLAVQLLGDRLCLPTVPRIRHLVEPKLIIPGE